MADLKRLGKTMKQTIAVFLAFFGANIALAAGDTLPTFGTWKEVFRYIARQINWREDEESLFTLAVDSSTTRVRIVDGAEKFAVVVKVDGYLPFNSRYSSVRGAKDGGVFYVFTTDGGRFMLVGTLEGSGYVLASVNGRCRITTSALWSAYDGWEHVYDWDGRQFRQTSERHVGYSSDGSSLKEKEPNQPLEPTAPSGRG